MLRQQQTAELRTYPSGQLLLSGHLYEVLQRWRSFSKEQKAMFFVRYGNQNFLGDEVNGLKVE